MTRGLAEVAALLATAPLPWWIGGGHAIEPAVGHAYRTHGDVDLGLLRRDHVPAVPRPPSPSPASPATARSGGPAPLQGAGAAPQGRDGLRPHAAPAHPAPARLRRPSTAPIRGGAV
ncbi:nucleotidyltransferase domain-containing protein [Nonomuraea sp. NPDC050478]|uniref:nucleotidyltransferase domain-containing protein n=1 Tax=Nonomuraea sp. NPDC050478 TaxID=3364365 RepID=UPI0037B9A5D7